MMDAAWAQITGECEDPMPSVLATLRSAPLPESMHNAPAAAAAKQKRSDRAAREEVMGSRELKADV